MVPPSLGERERSTIADTVARTTPQLTRVQTKERVVETHTAPSELEGTGKSDTLRLGKIHMKVQPEATLFLDAIVLSFLILEFLRRQKSRRGTSGGLGDAGIESGPPVNPMLLAADSETTRDGGGIDGGDDGGADDSADDKRDGARPGDGGRDAGCSGDATTAGGDSKNADGPGSGGAGGHGEPHGAGQQTSGRSDIPIGRYHADHV